MATRGIGADPWLCSSPSSVVAESIEITGHDKVLLLFADGRREVGPAVADSDEELVD